MSKFLGAYFETRKTASILRDELEPQGKSVNMKSSSYNDLPHMLVTTIKGKDGKVEKQIVHVTSEKHRQEIKEGLKGDR